MLTKDVILHKYTFEQRNWTSYWMVHSLPTHPRTRNVIFSFLFSPVQCVVIKFNVWIRMWVVLCIMYSSLNLIITQLSFCQISFFCSVIRWMLYLLCHRCMYSYGYCIWIELGKKYICFCLVFFFYYLFVCLLYKSKNIPFSYTFFA